MSHLLDEHDELLAAPARELTLSTGAILAIFLGLTLLCGLFFGFGYNVGHKSASAAALSARSVPEEPASVASGNAPSGTFNDFKAPTGTAKTSPSSPSTPDDALAQPAPGVRANAPSRVPAAAGSPAAPANHATLTTHAVPNPTSEARPGAQATVPPATPLPAISPGGTFFVQVAAVSHPEDASLLLGALRSRGYTVAERADPADKLIHLQIGPFASKPTAEATRQRLLADGYNAFIK